MEFVQNLTSVIKEERVLIIIISISLLLFILLIKSLTHLSHADHRKNRIDESNTTLKNRSCIRCS